ncbi:glyoxalase [Tsukamurella soli]
MTGIAFLTLEVDDVDSARTFYDNAFGLGLGLGDRLRLRASSGPTTGFRGFVLSLVVAEPAVVDSFVEPALAAGATVLKAARKSFWGYGSVLRAPDGTIWKVASSAKKNTGAPVRTIDDLVLLIGAGDVAVTKAFYTEKGLTVTRSFGRKYVEFAGDPGGVKLALYGRKAAAKDAGVAPEGTGSHRLVVGGDAGTFADPDGFEWEQA